MGSTDRYRPFSPPPSASARPRRTLPETDGVTAMLAKRGVRRAYPAGATILAQDTHNDHLIGLFAGYVAEEHVSRDGRRAILNIHGPGDLLGELSLLGRTPAQASVRVLEDVEAVLVSGWRVHRDIADDGDFAGEVLAAVARRARHASEALLDLSLGSVEVRVSRRLLRLVDLARTDTTGPVQLPVALRQEDLAAWAGVSYQAVVKTLADLRARGIVTTGRRWIRVEQVEHLRERALLL